LSSAVALTVRQGTELTSAVNIDDTPIT